MVQNHKNVYFLINKLMSLYNFPTLGFKKKEAKDFETSIDSESNKYRINYFLSFILIISSINNWINQKMLCSL